MKLNQTDVNKLKVLIELCAVGNIESFLIDENGYARGVNEDRTVGFISNQNIPNLSQKIGISRVSNLRQKIALFESLSDVTFNATETDRGEISSLEIAAGRNKVSYRCTSTMLIKAPKTFNDTPLFIVSMTNDEFKFIHNGIRMMGAKRIQLIIKKSGEVSFVAADSANDSFSSVLNTPVECTESEFDTSVFYYRTDALIPVLKALSGEIVFSVGAGGSVGTEISGHTVCVMPAVADDDEGE